MFLPAQMRASIDPDTSLQEAPAAFLFQRQDQLRHHQTWCVQMKYSTRLIENTFELQLQRLRPAGEIYLLV